MMFIFISNFVIFIYTKIVVSWGTFFGTPCTIYLISFFCREPSSLICMHVLDFSGSTCGEISVDECLDRIGETINLAHKQTNSVVTGKIFLTILCLTLRTTVTSARIPDKDACDRARNLCVFSRVQKGTQDWRIKDAYCSVYPWARSVTSRSFSGWEKVYTDPFMPLLPLCPRCKTVVSQSWGFNSFRRIYIDNTKQPSIYNSCVVSAQFNGQGEYIFLIHS